MLCGASDTAGKLRQLSWWLSESDGLAEQQDGAAPGVGFWLYGVFMLAVAWLQLLWAFVAIARPSRLLLYGGVILNAGVVAVYIVTRTIGDVIGPGAHSAEQAGFGDVLCTVLEAIVVAGCAWLLTASTERRAGRRQLVVAPTAVGAMIATLLSVALVAGGPELMMSMNASASTSTGGGTTSSIKLATTTPAGDITMPDMFPLGSRIAGARGAASAMRSFGQVPEAASEIAAETVAELGLPGLILAGGGPDTPQWTAARGWAHLDRAEVLSTSHRFPACHLTQLITATGVLRLVAEGRVGLDDPANDHLRTFRLADNSVTVRELLTYTGGVDDPVQPPFASSVPDLAAVVGPVLSCGGARGVFRIADGGYAALGQMIADVTRSVYPDAAARLVLEPLGMRDRACAEHASALPAFAPAHPQARLISPHRGLHLTGAAQVSALSRESAWRGRLPA